jgi:hypothetical protein
MGIVELKKGTPIRGMINSIVDGGERRSRCNNKKMKEAS